MTSRNYLTDNEIRRILRGQITPAELDRFEDSLLNDPRLVTFAQNLETEKEALLSFLKDCQPLDTDEMQERVEGIVSRMIEAKPKKPDEDTRRIVKKVPSNLALEETHFPPPNEVVAPLEFDHFRVVRKLGEGGMGTVYEAEDLKLHRRIALKTLRPEIASNQSAKDRFLREARSAASLTHDNIVPIYQVGESAGIPYLAMPLLVGLPLNEVLEERTKLTPAEAANYGMQIAQGLAAAHDQKLIHRDMKPGNLWIEAPTGRVKILDFGLARKVLENTQMTSTGAVIGTPSYMSPEQARGDHVDHRSDLFSLGVILYEMTTGVRPFRGDDTISLLTSLAIDEPIPPNQLAPEVSATFSKLICQLLQKKPQNRIQDTQEVAQQLGQIFKQSQHPESDTPTPPAPKPRRRLTKRIVAIVLLLLIGMGSGFAMLNLANKSKDDPDQRAEDGTIIDSPKDNKEDPKAKQPTLAERERQAAIWVIETGGVVSINGQVGQIRDVELLPQKDFELTGFVTSPTALLSGYDKFRGCKNLQRVVFGRLVTDDVLAVFEGCEKIRHLELATQTKITGRGLAHFRDCTEMRYINISGTTIKDEELSFLGRFTELEIALFSRTPLKGQFLESMRTTTNMIDIALDGLPLSKADWFVIKNYKKLQGLSVKWTPFDNEALVILKDLPELESLFLNGTQITDQGLPLLKNYKKLNVVTLTDTKITDKGLAEIAALSELTFLGLTGTQITDEGITHLEELKKLQSLQLPLQITDKSIPSLSKLTGMRRIDVPGLTDEGVRKLANALPQATIVGRSGAIPPSKQ